MGIITRAEVKTILKLEDSYTPSESIVSDSVVFKQLANKPNVSIIRVSADTINSTVDRLNMTQQIIIQHKMPEIMKLYVE